MIAPRLTSAQAEDIARRRAAREPWASIARDLGRNETALIRSFNALRAHPPSGYSASISVPDVAPPPPAPPRPAAPVVSHGCRVRPADLERIFVWPDTHVPYEDAKAFRVALDAAR